MGSADVRVEHQVKIADFMKWLERPGRTPRGVTQRQRIRVNSRDVCVEVMSHLDSTEVKYWESANATTGPWSAFNSWSRS